MVERPTFLIHASVVVTDGNKVLMVQEQKQALFQKWNLPGGHVDHGEGLVAAAERELREETKLSLPVTGLLGVYPGERSFRFVFRAEYRGGQEPLPGDEILALEFMQIEKVSGMSDEQLVSAGMLRKILLDLRKDVRYPLEMLRQ